MCHHMQICFERFKISWHEKSHPEENQFTNSIFVVRTHYIHREVLPNAKLNVVERQTWEASVLQL